MFLRFIPALCIALLFLFAAPSPHSELLPVCPSANNASEPPSTESVLVARADPRLPADERSTDRTPALQARTMRAVLREVLPEISLVAIRPLHQPGTRSGLIPCGTCHSGQEGTGSPLAGSSNWYPGLSPPA